MVSFLAMKLREPSVDSESQRLAQRVAKLEEKLFGVMERNSQLEEEIARLREDNARLQQQLAAAQDPLDFFQGAVERHGQAAQAAAQEWKEAETRRTAPDGVLLVLVSPPPPWLCGRCPSSREHLPLGQLPLDRFEIPQAVWNLLDGRGRFVLDDVVLYAGLLRRA